MLSENDIVAMSLILELLEKRTAEHHNKVNEDGEAVHDNAFAEVFQKILKSKFK